MSKTWKAQEIPQLCPTDIADEARVYVKAIRDKIDRINFLVQYLSISDSSMPENFTFTALRSSQLKVEICIESIATNLHSLADVLGQVINTIVLKPLQRESEYLSDRGIYIHTVKGKLMCLDSIDPVRSRYINEIVNSINNLLDSSEFRYVAAFTNMIKHRSLLDTELNIRFDSGNLLDVGYNLDPFTYKGNNFPQTQCKVVAMDYREKITNLIFDIGNNINNYCRAVFIMES